MSDFLSRLVERERGQAHVMAPRLPSLYEMGDRRVSPGMFEATELSETGTAWAEEDRAESHFAAHTNSVQTGAAPERATTSTAVSTISNASAEVVSNRVEGEVESASARVTAGRRSDREAHLPATPRASTHTPARAPNADEAALAEPRTDVPQAAPGTVVRTVKPAYEAEHRMPVSPLVVSVARHDEHGTLSSREPNTAARAPAAARPDLPQADHVTAMKPGPGVEQGLAVTPLAVSVLRQERLEIPQFEPDAPEHAATTSRKNVLPTGDPRSGREVVESARAAEPRVVVTPRVGLIARYDDHDEMVIPVPRKVASSTLAIENGSGITADLTSRGARHSAPRRVSAVPPPAPTIHVTIGRVEVRAVASPPVPTRTSAAPQPMGLDEYLRRRNQSVLR